MNGAIMTEKKRIILVGGMDYNVPKELKQEFDVVRHITKQEKLGGLPKVDFIFVITEWASHNLVETVKANSKFPVVLLPRGGWNAMKQELLNRSILMPCVAEPEAAPAVTPIPDESLFSSMSEGEVWKKYGASMIEAVQTTMEPKKVVSEDYLLEVLSLSGIAKSDCAVFLPKLQMKGILDPVSDHRWRLMAAPGVDFDNDRLKADSSAVLVDDPDTKGKLRRKVKSPTLVGMIAALPKGPYDSRRHIFEEMRKYVEFDALSDWQAKKYIDLALEMKIVDESNEKIYINQDPSLSVKRKPQAMVEDNPSAQEMALEVQKTRTVTSVYAAMQPKLEMGKTEAEKAWCYVVEEIKKERERLGNVLVHCRIEYMDGNRVLVVFLPPAVSHWMKFVESTENWGIVNRVVQERFSKDTVIRFMLDNGLRV